MSRTGRLVCSAVAAALLSAACTSTPNAALHPPSSSGPATPSGSASPRAAAPAPAPHPPRPLSWRPCDRGFQCASLPVQLDDRDPSKGMVSLALVRHPATGPGRRVGSLVVNPGGPGASADDFLETDLTDFPAEIRARFDLVAFDPRGVGRSAPVRCGTTAELDRYFAVDPAPVTPAGLQQLEAANAGFVRGCVARSSRVLPYVSTVIVADDLDRVRAAVGDQRLTYLGYSYGTAIGAAYLDRYPTHVRAMVLDGALDPALTWDQLLAGQAGGFDQALLAFLADCQRTNCTFRQAVSGDLVSAYDDLAARARRSPLPTGQARTVGAAQFDLGVGAGLYSRQYGWPAISDALTSAEHGNGAGLLALNDDYLERTPAGYKNVDEANTAVNCIDRPWPRDPAPYEALAHQVAKTAPRFGPEIALSGLTCETWPLAPAGTPHPVRAPLAPPVVVIGTTRDPATPYAWAQHLAAELASGVLLTHVGDGHTAYRVGAPACLLDPVDRYLLTAIAPAPARC